MAGGARAGARAGPLLLAAGAVALALYNSRSLVAGEEADAADLPAAFISPVVREVVAHVPNPFPHAMKGSAIFHRMKRALRPYGIRRKNVVFGTSISGDEINGDKGHVTTLCGEYYGRTFQLGGLGGYPSVGKTGFRAFASHAPDNGHVVLVFGPHIGYTPNGEPGKFLRRGQSRITTASGAINAAYSQITSGAHFGNDPSDMQQTHLRNKLRRHIDAVRGHHEPMTELVMKVYREVEEEVLALVEKADIFFPGKLALLGGVTINMPYPTPGYFVPLHFSVRAADMEPQDLMSSLIL